ncbi:hypothetical protein [Sporolactobacillus terrae]|uniref:phage tail protein n=1 Tax=Sporolactobacillus terrae TaxID=269673 RepID=UPI00048EF5B1|nr:hypothetical protein [Sporolactobacillus terrae]
MNKNLSAWVGAKISEFRTKMAEVNKIMHSTATGTEIPIDAETKRFNIKYAEIKAKLATFKKATTVTIKAKWNGLNKRFDEIGDKMDDLARGIRTFGTVAQSSMTGFAMSISTAAVPAIASLAAGVGALGPMLGVTAGGALGLSTAFAAAGAGAIGFGAIASANLSDVFEKMDKMSQLQDKMATATDLKQRNKLLKQQMAILDSMDASERRAYVSTQELKAVWSGITDSLKAQTVNIYAKSLDALSSVLKLLKPTFAGATQAVESLVDSLNKGLKSTDAINFFKTLGQTVGPSLEMIGRAGMNVMLGLMNLFTAFVPLGQTMAYGFEGMSKSFLKWTQTVNQSKGFQNFVSYVMTNGPKLLKIVGNIGLGIVGMFSAFAPASADMMTSLVNLTNQFKTWGQTLGQNQQFQQFIAYVQANAPAVIALIGNVVQIIGALAVGFAPVGAAVLQFLVPFTQMIGSFLKAHPAVASFVAVMVTAIGVMVALTPQIIAFHTLFGGISGALGLAGGAFTKLSAIIMGSAAPANLTFTQSLKFMAQGIWNWITALARGIAQAAVWTASVIASAATASAKFIASMAQMVASAIASGAKIVAQWVVMAAQATANAVKVAGAWTLSTGAAMAKAVASTVASVAQIVAQWVVMATKSTVNATKVAAAWALSAGKAMASAVASMIATAAVFVARWVFMGAQALVQAARMAAAWFIALGPVGWVTGAIVGLVALVIANWSTVKSWTISVWNYMGNLIKTVTAAIVNYVRTNFSGVYNAISSYINMAKSVISSVLNLIKGTFSNTLNFLVALVHGDFSGMKNAISSQMSLIKSTISRIWNSVMGFFKSINLFSIGRNIIQGLINGIGSLASAVGNKIMSIAGNIKGKIQGALGIHSPSRFMTWVGQMTGKGLVNGIAGMQNKVASASQGMAQAAQIAPQQTDFSYSSQMSTSGLDSVQQEVTANMEQTELSKRPAEINLIVGSKKVAKAIIDDVNNLQGKQEVNHAIFR